VTVKITQQLSPSDKIYDDINQILIYNNKIHFDDWNIPRVELTANLNGFFKERRVQEWVWDENFVDTWKETARSKGIVLVNKQGLCETKIKILCVH
jgi:hypothetical protein